MLDRALLPMTSLYDICGVLGLLLKLPAFWNVFGDCRARVGRNKEELGRERRSSSRGTNKAILFEFGPHQEDKINENVLTYSFCEPDHLHAIPQWKNRRMCAAPSFERVGWLDNYFKLQFECGEFNPRAGQYSSSEDLIGSGAFWGHTHSL
jgi:hypothetical protein